MKETLTKVIDNLKIRITDLEFQVKVNNDLLIELKEILFKKIETKKEVK